MIVDATTAYVNAQWPLAPMSVCRGRLAYDAAFVLMSKYDFGDIMLILWDSRCRFARLPRDIIDYVLVGMLDPRNERTHSARRAQLSDDIMYHPEANELLHNDTGYVVYQSDNCARRTLVITERSFLSVIHDAGQVNITRVSTDYIDIDNIMIVHGCVVEIGYAPKIWMIGDQIMFRTSSVFGKLCSVRVDPCGLAVFACKHDDKRQYLLVDCRRVPWSWCEIEKPYDYTGDECLTVQYHKGAADNADSDSYCTDCDYDSQDDVTYHGKNCTCDDSDLDD